MSKKPILVIMAAGMGSRYGGLKQLDPVDEQGHIILDFSVYDAVRAGFGKVVFVIKRENEAAFRDQIISRMEPALKAQGIALEVAFQELTCLPEQELAAVDPTKKPVDWIPEGREKPWGTAHAAYCAKEYIDAPFAVINADDYYGPTGFKQLADFLMKQKAEGESGRSASRAGCQDTKTAAKAHYAMVGFELAKTVTDNGYVSRGVCEVDEAGFLQSITERLRVEKQGEGIAYTEDEGASWTEIPAGARVSMNLWGFTEDFVAELAKAFADFLQHTMPTNPLKSECYLPFVVGDMLAHGEADVRVLPTPDKWYGVTYKEDKPQVVAAISKLKENGLYPQALYQ